MQLDGSIAGDVVGLRITTSGVVVRGLVINRFGENGVVIEGSSATGNTVEGNRIGTDPPQTTQATRTKAPTVCRTSPHPLRCNLRQLDHPEG
jgi:hypothetical protein